MKQKRSKPATLDDVATWFERLSRYVDTLGKEIAKVGERLAPHDTTGYFKEDRYFWSSDISKKEFPTVQDLYEAVRSLDERIKSMEHETRFMGSVLKKIDEGTYLRSDLKTWLIKDQD